MPRSIVIEHHRPVDYVVRDFRLQSAGFSFSQSTESSESGQLSVSGICPGCGGYTTITWDYGTGNGYKGLLRRGLSSKPTLRPRARTVCCDCGHAHANRPDGAIFVGCGAYWQVEIG